jgi:opacity protein-like surface antigen
MRTVTFAVALLLSLQVLAQENFASISFGASVPLGNYGNTGDLGSNGYAKTGGAIKFDAGYFPVSYLGIGGSFSFSSNYSIRDSLLQDMILYVEENATSLIDIPEDAEILYGSGFWNYINLFLGPHFSARVSQKLYFDVRILGGLSIIRPPDQELSISYDGVEIFSYVSNNRLSFGFTGGGGLRYALNNRIALKLGADYIHSRSRFDFTFNLFRGVAEHIPPVQSDFRVQTVELSAGLAYSF